MNNFFEQRNKQNLDRTTVILDTLPSFCKEFFIGIQSRTTPLTRLNYAYDLGVFFHFLHETIFTDVPLMSIDIDHIRQLTAFDIERFLDYLNNYMYNDKTSKCSESAKSRKLATLRSFFKYYFNKDKLKQNITTKVETPKIRSKNIVRLEADEVAILLDTVENGSNTMSDHQHFYTDKTKHRDMAIISLFLGTGIRVSELIGINTKDIDLDNNTFVITRKGGNKAILYFGDEVAKALHDYIEWRTEQLNNPKSKQKHYMTLTDALFVSMQGKRISSRAVQNLIDKFCAIVSPLKKISPHKLRSTFGTSLYRATGDIYVVAEVLGHKNVNTTKKHYAASSEQIKRDASTAVKLRDT